VDSFIQKIAGIHHVMVAGNYKKAVCDAMLRMNARIIGPSDLSGPGILNQLSAVNPPLFGSAVEIGI